MVSGEGVGKGGVGYDYNVLFIMCAYYVDSTAIQFQCGNKISNLTAVHSYLLLLLFTI